MLPSWPTPRAVIGAIESQVLAGSRRLIALGSVAALVAGTAHAQGAPLSLAETLKLAVAHSQQLVSQRAMVEASREMAVAGGELPDPKLKVGVENVPTDGPDAWSLTRDFMTMSKIGVMQEFPRAEKRKLKAERAERDAERGSVVVESTTLTVQRDAATAWLTRRYAADTERVIAAQIAEAELAVTTVTAAYRAGKAPQSELIAAQSVVIDLRNRATDAVAQSRRARIALARYIGADAERPPGETPDFARLPDDASLADIDAQPGGSPYSNMVSLMFSIDLPWSPGTRQDREHAAKLKELDAARAMREDARRMRSAEVQSMLIEWQSARAQAQRIRTELLPLTVQRREAALAAYRGGTGALAAVLDARRAELDAELALIAQEQSVAKAWAFLNFVVPGKEGS